MTNDFEPTHEDFKAMKKALKLTNADIARIVGLSVGSVENQTRPTKELPTWIRSMIYVWKNYK